MFLLDTNVVSEWTKPRPNAGVIAWLEEVDEDRVFISVVTLTELRYGIDRLSAGKRRTQLSEWLEDHLPARFEDRILGIDAAIADACGRIVAGREEIGRPIGAMDAYLAATAKEHGFTVVTRDESDFRDTVSCLNPWI